MVATWDNGDELVALPPSAGPAIGGSAPAAAPSARGWDNGDELVSPAPAALVAPVAASPAPQVGGLEAAARGAAQGLTFGFGDEAYALGAGVKSWQRGEGFQAGYDRALADYRGRDKAASAQHPYIEGGSKIAGGVAAAVPAMIAAPAALGMTAATTGGKLVAGAATGAGYGAVQGFGEGEGGAANRLASGFYGGLGGSAFGAASVPVGILAGKAVSAAAGLLPQRAAGLGAAGTKEAIAALREAGPDVVQQRLAELGPDAMLLDAAQPFLGRAQGLAATPGAPGERIVSSLAARDAGTDARLARGLNDALGPAPVPSQVEAQFARQRAAAGPMYEEALSQGRPVDTSAVLAEIGQRLNAASGAERAALMKARELLVEQGPNGVVARTDPRYLHGAKRSLDDLIHYGDDTIGIPRGALSREDGAASAIRSRLNQALEEQVPGYAGANLRARTAHGASEALESGSRILGGGQGAIHPADFAADLARRPIEQQAALRAGVRADLDRTVGTRANDLPALAGELQRPTDWNRAKLNETFGREAVDEVARVVDANGAMRQSYVDVARGAQTAQRSRGADAMSLRDLMPRAGEGGVMAVAGALGGPAAAAIPAAIKAGKIGLNAIGRASDRARNAQIADILTQQGPQRDRTVQALADALLGREASQIRVSERTAALARALMTSSDRNTGGAERANRLVLARLLAQPAR